MKTTINNNFRIFLLTGDLNKHFVCNIEEFKKCFSDFEDKDQVKIKHLWNNDFKTCSKKSVLEMAISLNLENPFTEFYKVKATFNGRLSNAIGKFYKINSIIYVPYFNAEEVEKNLYTRYDHIQGLKFTLTK